MVKKRIVDSDSEDSCLKDEEQYSQNKSKKKKNAVSKSAKKVTVNDPQVVKSKTKAVKKKTQNSKQNAKQDKKKDFLPGQKYQTPDDEDGARAFYQSLYNKNPQSEIARKYCLEYGILQRAEADKIQREVSKTKK